MSAKETTTTKKKARGGWRTADKQIRHDEMLQVIAHWISIQFTKEQCVRKSILLFEIGKSYAYTLYDDAQCLIGQQFNKSERDHAGEAIHYWVGVLQKESERINRVSLEMHDTMEELERFRKLYKEGPPTSYQNDQDERDMEIAESQIKLLTHRWEIQGKILAKAEANQAKAEKSLEALKGLRKITVLVEQPQGAPDPETEEKKRETNLDFLRTMAGRLTAPTNN